MTSLFETPVPALIVGLLTTSVFFGAFLKTGRRSLIAASLLAIATTIGLVLLERAVVTDRERVEQTIYDLAAAVERNDVQGALSFVHSQASKIRPHAEREFATWSFSRVVVKNNLEVELQGAPQATRAVATFNVVVVLGDRQGQIVDQHVARVVRVTLVKEEDDWRVWEYSHLNVLGNPDQYSVTVEH